MHKTEPLQTQHDQIIVEKALLCLLCKLFFLLFYESLIDRRRLDFMQIVSSFCL